MGDSTQNTFSFRLFCKTVYVRMLLALLPFLINLLKHFSTRIAREVAYLNQGYTFQLIVKNTGLSVAARKNDKGHFIRVAPSRQARDIEPGSGLESADPQAVTIDYVITFRSLDYAFACFSGGMSLQQALAMRAFSTRGPNDSGVALTYMFTALLRVFFFWRLPYRIKRTPSRPIKE